MKILRPGDVGRLDMRSMWEYKRNLCLGKRVTQQRGIFCYEYSIWEVMHARLSSYKFDDFQREFLTGLLLWLWALRVLHWRYRSLLHKHNNIVNDTCLPQEKILLAILHRMMHSMGIETCLPRVLSHMLRASSFFQWCQTNDFKNLNSRSFVVAHLSLYMHINI